MLVRVFAPGGITVEPGDDDSLRELRPMERRLLAALGLVRPSAVPVDALIDALWGGAPPASARKTVQTNVLRVRGVVGRDVIETVEGGYRLSDGVDTDIEQFDRAVRHAEELAGATTATWDDALRWCSGPPLDPLGEWDVAVPVLMRLAERRRSAVEARWALALRRPGPDLVPALEGLVAAEPVRERRWVLLLDALGSTGRRAEGLRAFERARRVLATELGVPPGPELVAAYEALLREPVDDVQPGGDPVVQCDRCFAEGHRALAEGAWGRAVAAFCEAAHAARRVGDRRRFAEAALAANGDGWRTSLDATNEVVALLGEAIEWVPPGPTPTRARLLARWAVASSHHRTPADGEHAAVRALAIGSALGQDELLALALHARAVVVADPTRRHERRAWLDELLGLAARRPGAAWRRWALPLVARLDALEGDLDAALEALDELRGAAAAVPDAVSGYGAAHGPLLEASIAGDWRRARAAAADLRVVAEDVLFDPSAAALQHLGVVGTIDLLAGRRPGPPPQIEWPTQAMELAVRIAHADGLARSGDRQAAAAALAAIDLASVASLERDGYWLPTLAMLADVAFRTGSRPAASAVRSPLAEVVDLTVVDPGLVYRGAVAHHAGLAALTLGKTDEAQRHLARAVEVHHLHGSPWMLEESQRALAHGHGRA